MGAAEGHGVAWKTERELTDFDVVGVPLIYLSIMGALGMLLWWLGVLP